MKNEELKPLRGLPVWPAVSFPGFLLLAALLLLTACSGSDDALDGTDPPPTPTEERAAVSFASKVATPTSRVTTGLINTDDQLKAMTEGFGVFAYQTETKPFATQFASADPPTEDPSKEPTTYSSFANFFMQNQQVKWDVQYVDDKGNGVKDWVYEPLKYWPNYSNNTDASDGGDTPGPRYISFFAYAPYVSEAEAAAATSTTPGVINFTRSDDRTPHVIYRIGAADQQVDLLWANATDAKRNGEGLISIKKDKDNQDSLVYQKVPLKFHHALAAIDIYVQRVYDEPAYTGKTPDDPAYPRLFVSELQLTSAAPATGKNPLQTSGKLSLIDGTWEDDGTWVGGQDVSAPDVVITYDETMFNDTVRGTANATEEYIRDAELDKWSNSTYGVNEEERNLLKNRQTQVLLPRKVTLKPTLTYSMVTRDDALRVKYLTDSDDHRYSRIVNEVEGNSVTLDLVAGKRYTLLIRIGVEHVTFELVSVVDWDFPMRYNPSVVTDFEEENIGHIVNEE